MACKYWYDGNWRTEAEFKSILENGLIDQLVNDQVVSLKEFELDSSKIKNEAKKSISKNPIELRIRRKIQRFLNTGTKNGLPISDNPLTVLQQAADARGNDKKHTDLMLIIKTTSKVDTGQNTEGDTVMSSIHTGAPGKNSKKIAKALKNSKVDFTEYLEDGFVYMLVPSAYGLYPVKLFTNKIKDTNDFAVVKEKLKALEKATDATEIQKITVDLESMLYRIGVEFKVNEAGNKEFTLSVSEVIKTDEGVGINEFTFSGDLQATIDYLGERIRKVDFADINTGTYNADLANANVIKTDLFHENGNFFHSSSFFLETYQLSTEDKESYKNQVLEFDSNKKLVVNEDPTKKTEERNPDASSNKKDEDPVYEEKIPTDENLDILMQIALEAEAEKNAAKKKSSKASKEESGDIYKKDDELTSEDLAEIKELIDENAAEESVAYIEEEGINAGVAALEEAAKREKNKIDPNKDLGDDIDTDVDTSPGSYLDPNQKAKIGPKADLPTKEDAKKAREKGWESLKRMLGESAVRQSGRGGTVRHIKRFESIKNYLTKESYEMLEEALKNGDELYGLFTTAVVLISELAPEGTEAHEAFHVIFNLVLPLEKRFKILNEVFEKYKEEIPLTRKEITLEDGTKEVQYVRPTFRELEEFLADKFMAYEQSQEVDELKPTDKKTKKKDILLQVGGSIKEDFKNTNAFFKGLSRMLQVFFKKNRALNIDTLFQNVNLGVYANSINFKNTILKNSIRQSAGASQRKTDPNKKYANPIEKKWAFRYFNTKFKKVIEGFRQQIDPERKLTTAEIINYRRKGEKKIGIHTIFTNAITSVVHDIANLKKLRAEAIAKDDKSAITKYTKLLSTHVKFYKIITNNQKAIKRNDEGRFEFIASSDLLEQFNRWLKTNEGIDITYGGSNLESLNSLGNQKETTEEDYIKAIEAGEDTPDRIAQINSAERNPKQGMRQQLISFFANIPKYNSNGDPSTTSFGIADVEESNVVFATLISQIANSYTMEEFDKKLAKIDKPWRDNVIELFINNPRLKTLFWANFASKNFAEFISVYDVNGQYTVFNSNAKTIEDIIKEDLISGFLSTNNPIFKTNKPIVDWVENIDPKKAKILLDTVLKIKEVYMGYSFTEGAVEGNKESQEFFEQEDKFIFNQLSEVFASINIKLTTNQIEKIYQSGKDFENKRARLGNLITRLVDISKKLVGTTVATIKNNKPVYKIDAKKENPFTHLLPETSIKHTSDKKSGKSLVNLLATAIEPGLDAELVSSFRGIGGKTKYNIILSGQINKMLEEVTNETELNAYINKIKNDPLYRNLPLLKDLVGDESLRNTFKAVILDGLARKGKNKAIPYDKMSDIELESTNMALFFNRGSIYGNKKETFIKLGVPSDSPTAQFIKTKYLSKEEIIDKLVDTGIGEIERINKINTLKKENPSHPLLLNDNYAKNSTKFQLLTFLNKIPFKKLQDKKVLKAEIEKFFTFDLNKNTFLKKHIDKYKEVGIIEAINDANEIVFAEGVLDSDLDTPQKQNAFFIDYLLNTFYYQTQTNVLFAGDPSFYKNTEDWQKRFKQIFSPGTYTTGTGTFGAIILEDSMVPTSEENLKHIEDIIDNSDMVSAEKETLKIAWRLKASKKAKDQNNESDGGTIVSLDFRKQVLQDLGEWGDAHDKAYERIKNGNETIADLEIIDPPASPLKPFMFTTRDIDGIVAPFQVKNAETVLTKSLAFKKNKAGKLVYPKLAAVYNDMQKGLYEVALFESAVKVGGIKNKPTDNEDARFTHYEVNTAGEYAPSVGYNGMKVFQIDRSDYRRQQETPTHHIDERGNFGSQLRTLIISDINLTGKYALNIKGIKKDYSGEELVAMYQDIIFDDLKESYEAVEKDIVNSDGTINYVKLIPLLREHAKERNMGDSYLQAISPVLVGKNGQILKEGEEGTITTALPLFHPRILYQTESLLHSIFRNGVVKQKIKGGGLINTPSYGISSINRETAGLIEERFHPKLRIEDGEIIWEVLMPHTSKKYFPINEKGEVNYEFIKEHAPELLEIIANRIPTEDKYSMFNIRVIGFTPPSMANTIIMPPEVTFISGLDFDIDKLYFMSKVFKLDPKTRRPKIVKYFDTLESKEDAKELAQNIFLNPGLTEKFSKILKNKDEFLKKVYELVEEKAIAIKNKKRSKAEIKELIKEAELERLVAKNKDEETVAELDEEIADLFKIINEVIYDENYDIEEKNAAIEEVEERQEELINFTANFLWENRDEISISNFNSRAARDNQKINILQSILQSKYTAPAIINPGNFDTLKYFAARIRLLKAGKKKEANLKGKKLLEAAEKLDEDIDFNMAYPATQLELFRRNMDGLDLIGIMANHNTHHAKAQYTNLKLKNSLTFNGETYQALNKTTSKSGARISRSLATKLAAVVDNAKDPISSFLNFNTLTANIVALGDRIGVDENFIFALLNQPVILKLTAEIKNSQTIMGRAALISTIKGELIAELNQKIPEDDKTKKYTIKELTTTLLEGTLSDPKSIKSAKIQKSALALFEQLFEIGEELSRGIRASKTDSITSYGATGASDWVFLNNQRRILLDKETVTYEGQGLNKIEGLEEIFLPINPRQRMNPAFTTFGLYKPIGVYEKIFPTIGELDEADPTNIVLSTLGKIKESFTAFKSSGVLSAEEAQMINSNYLNYIASEFKFFNHSQSKDILEKLPEELLTFKNELPDNSPFKPLLDQLYVVRPDNRTPISRIEFYNSGKFDEDIEALSDSWERMLLDSDPKNVEMAKKLIKYTFFANGFSFGPYTFANLIPIKFFTNEYQASQPDLILQEGGGRLTLNELFQKRLLEKSYNGEYNQRYIRQFVRNFSGRHTFLPTAKIDKELTKEDRSEFLELDGKITDNFHESNNNIIKDTEGNLIVIRNSATKNLRNRDEDPIQYIKTYDTNKSNHYNNNTYELVDETIEYNNSNNPVIIYKYAILENIGVNNFALQFDSLNRIEESIKPSPRIMQQKSEAHKLAQKAINTNAVKSATDKKGIPKTFTPKEKIPPSAQPAGGVKKSTSTTTTDMYRIQREGVEYAVELKNGVFQIFNTDMKQLWKNKTPETDPIVKELYDLFLAKINSPLNTILGNLGTSINWGGLATDFETKFYGEKETSSIKILNKLLPEVDTKSTLHQIITKLKQVDFPVTFLPLAEFNNFEGFNQKDAYMFIYEGHIYLNDAKIKKSSGQSFVKSFLHEIVHGYTINKQGELTGKEGKELTELFDVAKNLSKTPEGRWYGFTNEKEFVAEIYTNKAFAEHIKSLVINEDDGKTTSVWKQFAEWVTSLFLGKKPTSTEGKKIYERSMKLIESLIDQRIELQESITALDEIFVAERIAERTAERIAENEKERNKRAKFFTDNEEFIITEVDVDNDEGEPTIDIVDYLYGIKTMNGINTKTIMSEVEWNNLNVNEKHNILKCN